PMKQWRPLMGMFLDELLRTEGLDAVGATDRCRSCGVDVGAQCRRFRCRQCGDFMQCEVCVVGGMRRFLCIVQRYEWNGRFWVKTTLRDLGCVFQLGHGGFSCPHPAARARSMVVLDFPHLHTINFKYCACDKSDDANNLQQLLRNRWYPATTVDPGTCATFATLETFRLLNVVSNVNVQDFVKTMERRSDATRV
ncbi:hypothetical protein R3P38DRAFT_2407559, partial [Favolaschia claudopus]